MSFHSYREMLRHKKRINLFFNMLTLLIVGRAGNPTPPKPVEYTGIIFCLLCQLLANSNTDCLCFDNNLCLLVNHLSPFVRIPPHHP